MALQKQQRGVVLAVCLILLAVVTLLGVASMGSTGLEMKMASNTQERQLAFNAAEVTLRQAENTIRDVGYTRAQLQNPCTVAAGCFDNTCTNGLCFVGSWPAGTTQNQCARFPVGAPPPTIPVWDNAALWLNPAQYVTVPIAGNTRDGRYIVEFLCFIEGVTGTVATDTGDVLYRITAVGTGNTGRSQVVLQSTYRAPTP